MSAPHNTSPSNLSAHSASSRPSTPITSPPIQPPFPRERCVSVSLAHRLHRSNSPITMQRSGTPATPSTSSKRSSLMISPSLSLACDLSFDEEGIPHFASSPRETSHSRKHSLSGSQTLPISVGEGDCSPLNPFAPPFDALQGHDRSVVTDGSDALLSDGACRSSTPLEGKARRAHLQHDHHRANSFNIRQTSRPPFLSSNSRTSSASSVNSLSTMPQAPTDPQARALLETAMRRAEEESEKISVNLLRRLSSAEKQLAARGVSSTDGHSSDEDFKQTKIELDGLPALAADVPLSLPDDSPRSDIDGMTVPSREPMQTNVSTPIAPQMPVDCEVPHHRVQHLHHLGERNPLTPRVRQVTFESPPASDKQSCRVGVGQQQDHDGETEAEAKEPYGGKTIRPGSGERFRPTLFESSTTNPRRWSADVFKLGGKLSASPESYAARSDRTQTFSSPPSPLPHRHRPGTPVPPAVLQPTIGTPLRTPLTPLAPLDEERRRHHDDLHAWKMWGLEVWNLAKAFKKRVSELEEKLAEQGGEDTVDDGPTKLELTKSMRDVEIPSPPSILAPYPQGLSPSRLTPLYDPMTPARVLQSKRPFLRPLVPPSTVPSDVSGQLPFVPPSLAMQRIMSPSNTMAPRTPLRSATEQHSNLGQAAFSATRSASDAGVMMDEGKGEE